MSSYVNRILWLSDFSLLSWDDNECLERFDGDNCSSILDLDSEFSYDRLFVFNEGFSISFVCWLSIDDGIIVWNIEGASRLSVLPDNEGNSSVIEGGGEGDTGVTCNGVKSCNKVCLIDSDNDG